MSILFRQKYLKIQVKGGLRRPIRNLGDNSPDIVDEVVVVAFDACLCADNYAINLSGGSLLGNLPYFIEVFEKDMAKSLSVPTQDLNEKMLCQFFANAGE